VTQQKSPILWTLFTVLLVSALMFVAAQTTGGAPAAQTGGAPQTGGAAPADPNAVVLRLDDTTVTAAEFEPIFNIALRSVVAQQGVPLDEATLAQFSALRPSFLDQFATQRVLAQEAQARNLTVTQAEVDEQVAQARESAGDEFDRLLSEAGYADEAALRDYIRDSLLVQRAVEAIQGDINVTDADVRAFYDENQEQFTQPEQVCVHHILLPDEETAAEVYAQLEGGGDFEALARENSTDPGSAESGGDLGCISPGQTVPEFEEAAFGAEVGETTEPVQSQFGFHIIRVDERQPSEVAPFAEVRAQVREQLVNTQLSSEIAELRETSGIELFPENLPQTVPAAPTAQPEAAPEGEGND
jgi:peptidyl-prolyl cis-trans isomerase C